MSLLPVIRSLRTAWFMALVLFVSGMLLYTAHNDFPFYYHPDEKGKIGQILKHSRNCNHPLMLLTATAATTVFHWGPLTSQEVVEKGRDVSAFFSAIAVVGLALLARRMAGAVGGPLAAVLGGWCAGVLTLMDSLMFDLAHYMKEDPALTMGMALTFLSLHVFWKRRDEISVVFVGISIATAVSGKYLGWLLFPFALWIVHAGAAPAERARYRKLFWKSFGVAFAVLNYSLIFNPFKPFASLKNEMAGVIWGHHGLGKEVPHAAYVRQFLALPPAIISLFGIYVAGLLVRFKKVTPPEWLALGFTLLLMGMMSFSPKSSYRYFLPVEMMVCFGAGMGLIWLASAVAALGGRARPAILATAWALLFAACVWNVQPVLAAHYQALTTDTRVAMRSWLVKNLPASAVIAEDDRVHLWVDGENVGIVEKLPMRVLNNGYAADFGTLEEMRSQGITHVAVSSAKYKPLDLFTPTAKVKGDFVRRKAFYTSLGVLQGSTPAAGVRQIWKSQGGLNGYLQPELTLFEITQIVQAAPGK